jgi:hypothetical protein
MKSKPYKLHGKLFQYDFDNSMVEYIAKADAEMLASEKEWKANHNGRPLYGIDKDGYIILGSVGLHRENWNKKAARDEYLSGWILELDEEAEALSADFVKYELPYLI